MNQLRPIIESRNAQLLEAVRIPEDLRQAIQDTLRQRYLSSFNSGKTQAADELEIPAVQTSRDYVNLLQERAVYITQAYISDMVFEAKNTVSKQIVTTRSDSKIEQTVEEAIQKRGETIKGIATGDATREVNEGRRQTHGQAFEQGTVQGFVYSAVLDNRTTLYCRTMNGTVITAFSDYDSFPVNAHPRCRSHWVAIKESDGRIQSTLGKRKRKQMEDELEKYDLSQDTQENQCNC
jgi:hypothetical protein